VPWPGDICFTLWERAYATGAMTFPEHGRVLEIGCAESDWIGPLKAERPDLYAIGIDWRVKEWHTADADVTGDVLTFPFAPESFDAIVGISSFEHIGLGHYDRDPLDEDGDSHCLERVQSWLKPGGWVYGDVPYDPAGFRLDGTACRVYDEAAWRSRLMPAGLRVERTWYVPQLFSDDFSETPQPSMSHFGLVAFLARKV
jgi:SAM-dependent methyltransferase